jgi:hypothetical protein
MCCKGCTEVCYLISVCLAFLALVATSLLQFFSWSSTGVNLNIFNRRSDELWNLRNNCLTDTEWVFFMWAAVYICQLPWVFYGVTLICRKTKTGNYLYVRPPIMPSSVYISFFLALAFTLVWAFLRDQEPVLRLQGFYQAESDFVRFSIICSALAMLVTVIFSHLALSISIYKIAVHEKELLEKELHADPWIIRLVVQNCISAHATWTTIVLFYNIAMILKEEANVESNIGCYITFGLMIFYVIIFFVIDIILIVRVQCMFILPYFIIMVSQCATVMKNINTDADIDGIHLTLAGGLAGIVFILFLVKLVLFFMMMRRIKARKGPEMIRPTDPEDSPPPSPRLPLSPRVPPLPRWPPVTLSHQSMMRR